MVYDERQYFVAMQKRDVWDAKGQDWRHYQ